MSTDNRLTWLQVESPGENCGIKRARLGRWVQGIAIFPTRGADARVKWQRSLEHIQDFRRFKSYSTAKGKWTQSPPLTKQLLTIDSCWKREKKLSPKDCHLLYQLHSMSGPTLKSSCRAQNGLQGFLCAYFVSTFFFCHIGLFCCCLFSFLVWAFCFDFFRDGKRKEIKLGGWRQEDRE